MTMHLLKSPRAPFLVALIIGSGLFVSAVYMGETMRLAACPLCILQRMLCIALALSAALGLLVGRSPVGRVVAALLMTISTATGAFVAGYQTWIQRFATDVQCSGEAAWWELFVDWAGEKAPLLFQANGLCSDPGWKFLGLSIAEYSLIGFCMLTLLSLYVLFRKS